MSQQLFEVAIVGAGPGGLSAAARAGQRRVPHVLLEASDKHANTIQQYQKRKHVMSEPSVLPLRSDMAFKAGAREDILDNWEETIERANVNIRYKSEVTAIKGQHGHFQINLKDGAVISAKNVILALGLQGNPRKLGVPGEDLPFIQTTLESADDLKGETIVVVGAGDAAIENAVSLANGNRVILVNRRAEFARAKEGNVAKVLRAIDTEKLQCLYDTEVSRVEQISGRTPGRIVLKTPNGPKAIDCHRIIARLGAVAPRKFVESIGVEFVSPEADALPRLSPRYESSVPGLYIIGALAGYPLIKQAMNQGYEAVEYMLGNAITPSDHGILEKKLRALRFGKDVDGALSALRQRLRLFHETSALNLRELVLVSEIVIPKPGKPIFVKNDYSASIYNIIQGEVHLRAGPGQMITLRPGQFFGEMSLISGRPREVTAIAGRNCVLLESPDRAMKKMLRVEDSVRNYVDRAATLRSLKYLLMPYTSADTIHALSDTAQIHRIKANEPIFKEGDPVDRLYLLRSGSVTLSRQSNKQDVVVAYVAAGSYIDPMGSLSGKPARTVTARATVATEAISIEHNKFARVMARDRQLLGKVQLERKEQVSQYARMQAKPEAGQVLSFLMSHGVGEATNVLVIDESLCVGCDQCENACAATHQGVSRLDRKAGPSFYSLHLPTSCRHCEHPHCMKDCPPDAIHRQVNGEVYIDDTCIGCGNCEENCPYGVIQMAKVKPRASILVKMGVKRQAEIAKTAVKCDMCKDLKAGPACVNACPTGAAIRIHAEEVMNLAKRRAAGLK